MAKTVRLVTTSVDTLLRRASERLELPIGIKLGIKEKGRQQWRSDKRFQRPQLARSADIDFPDTTTINEALRALILPVLPKTIRPNNIQFLVYAPGSRKPAKGSEHLSTVRGWGDGRTAAVSEVFQTFVDEAEAKLWPIWHETVEDVGEEEIFLRAVCKIINSEEVMIGIIRRHFASQPR